MFRRITYHPVVIAVSGAVYKSDPTPNPSLREGLNTAMRQN